MSIAKVTECDKCGSKEIVYRTRNSAWILCAPCAEEMAPQLEEVGYGPIWGWGGFMQKLPKSMRVWANG